MEQKWSKSGTKVEQDFRKISANLTNDETEVFPENLTLAYNNFFFDVKKSSIFGPWDVAFSERYIFARN